MTHLTHLFSLHNALSPVFSLVPIIPCILIELFTSTNKAIDRVFTHRLVTNYTPGSNAITWTSSIPPYQVLCRKVS